MNEPFLPPSHRDLKSSSSSSSSSTAADSMAKTNKQTQAKQEERGVKLPRGGRIFPLTLSKSTLSYASLRTEVWKSAKDSLVIGCKSTCTYPRLARKIPY